MAMRIEELTRLDQLDAVREPWAALAGAAEHDTPYLLPEFMLPWLRRLDPRDALRIAAVWQEQRLVGFAPLVQRTIKRLGVRLVLRTFPEAAPSPPCDVLVDPGAAGVEEALLEHWRRQHDWDAIELGNAPVESRAMERIAAAASARSLRVERSPELSTYYVPIAGSWQDFLSTRGANTRRSLRRGLRYLEGLGPVRFAAAPADLPYAAAAEVALQVIRSSWKDHPHGARSWNAFVAELIATLAQSGRATVHFMFLGQRPIAYLLDVRCKQSTYALHSAYDLEFQHGNPGQILLAHALQQAHRDRVERYDFTGDKEYLSRWSAHTRRFQRVRIHGPGRLAAIKLRAYDWLHGRRVAAVLDDTERIKQARKQRSARGAEQ